MLDNQIIKTLLQMPQLRGLNNAIRGIIRRSFGFHSFENLKRRVLIEFG